MALMKKAATIAVLAGTGIVASAGIAAASCPTGDDNGKPTNDNWTQQSGVVPVNAANGVNVSPNVGCPLDNTARDANVQSLVGLVPIAVSLNHTLEHLSVNALANGNDSTDVNDDSCTSNQGSSQAGNNSHGSWGAGNSVTEHNTGNGAGASNSEAGEGAGGLLGGTGILGTGL